MIGPRRGVPQYLRFPVIFPASLGVGGGRDVGFSKGDILSGLVGALLTQDVNLGESAILLIPALPILKKMKRLCQTVQKSKLIDRKLSKHIVIDEW